MWINLRLEIVIAWRSRCTITNQGQGKVTHRTILARPTLFPPSRSRSIEYKRNMPSGIEIAPRFKLLKLNPWCTWCFRCNAWCFGWCT